MALYHTYRPQTFGSIIDQEHVVTTLVNQLKTGAVAHAYLFSGARGVGKTTTARVLAKALNCEKRKPSEAEPCNACPSCEEIGAARSIDVIEIDAASHTGVDHVREHIIDNAQFKPTKAAYKIFIIDEVHMLSVSAFNALLKTLEEPPAHVIFVLATTELHKLPETIISRCQRFHFKKVSYEIMRKHLETVAAEEGVTVEGAVLDRIVGKSDGCVRDAVSLLDQVMATGDKKITAQTAALILPSGSYEQALAFAAACIRRDLNGALNELQTALSNGINLAEYMEDVLRLLRTLLLCAADPKLADSAGDMGDRTKQALLALQKDISPPQLIRLIDLLLRRRLEMKSSPIPQLPLEMAAVEWCSDDVDAPPQQRPPLPSSRPPAGPNMEEKKLSAAERVSPPAAAVPPSPAPEKPKGDPDTQRVMDDARAGSALTREAAEAAWRECAKKMEQDSPSLAFVLAMAQMETVHGSTVALTVPYAFHRDTLVENKENRRKIESFLLAALGVTVRISVSVAEAPAKKDNAHADLGHLAAAFGGEVIA